jgi:transposase
MFLPEDRLRIWLCTTPTDMRKSYDGLMALAKNHLGEDPLGGALFVFVNRRRTQLKCLYFDRNGYCIWSKRLEAGQFQVNWDRSGKQAIDLMTLRLILEGLSRERFKQQRRYRRPPAHVVSHQQEEKSEQKAVCQRDSACVNERQTA